MLRKNNRRVVVTGLGVVSSIGTGWQEFWRNLISGKSGISEYVFKENNSKKYYHVGSIRNFESSKILNQSKLPYCRTSHMALKAVALAYSDASLDLLGKNKKVGFAVGTTMAEVNILELIDKLVYKLNYKKINPRVISNYPPSRVSNNVGRLFSLCGKNYVFGNACASGNYSIGFGYDQIKLGKTDMMVVGGSDSFSNLNFTGFRRMLAMAVKKCQPFDKNRQGMLVGEGAGVLILEELESALKRKAKIYAEILGYGMSCDASHMTIPNVSGVCKCILKALESANLSPSDIDYICAHGTGTKMNDFSESKAVEKIFYEKNVRVPISSIKSMLGHSMGAASAIESVASCLVIEKQIMPPTINFITPDEFCDVDCVPNVMRKSKIKNVLNNSFAFGGNNASIVFQKYKKV